MNKLFLINLSILTVSIPLCFGKCALYMGKMKDILSIPEFRRVPSLKLANITYPALPWVDSILTIVFSLFRNLVDLPMPVQNLLLLPVSAPFSNFSVRLKFFITASLHRWYLFFNFDSWVTIGSRRKQRL